MSKLSKNIGLCGATILIVFDAWMIFSCLKLRGEAFFNQIFSNMLPCGLLLGAFALCVLLEKSSKNKLGIAAMIIFGIAAIMRLFIGILYISDQIKFINKTNASIEEILKNDGLHLVEFFAFIPLIISAIFLVIYILNGKMQKATQIVGGVSLIALAVVFVTHIYQLVSSGMYNGQSIVEIYLDIFEGGYIWDILLIIGYALVLGSLTGAMEKKE